MLFGTYRSVPLSEEGLVLPPALRDGLGQGYVITRGLDGCVSVFPLPAWEALLERVDRGASFLKTAARIFQRHLLGGASIETLGPDGMVHVPDHLRQHAELDEEVVLVGVWNRVEVWNPQRWSHEEYRMIERSTRSSEELSELGV
jgi:MraZ protein